MRGADTGAGLHRNNAFHRHRHVDDDPVTLLDAERFQAIGELADFLMQFLICDPGDIAAVGFKNHRDFVGIAIVQMHVETVIGNVKLAIVKPFVERCIGFVQHLGEWRLPLQVFTCQPAPEPFVVLLSFGYQSAIRVHAGNCCSLGKFCRGGKNAGFLTKGFDVRHAVSCF